MPFDTSRKYSLKSTLSWVVTPETWISNHIHCFPVEVITHPCRNFCSGLAKPQLRDINSLALSQNGQRFADDIFKCIFFNENVHMLIKFEVCSYGSNWQIISIGLNKGLAPLRRQAIIWNNVDILHWHIYVSPSFNECSTYHSSAWFSICPLKYTCANLAYIQYLAILKTLGCMSTPELSNALTHLPLVPHICVSKLDQHWFR